MEICAQSVDMAHFGETLFYLRDAAKLTQDGLGAKLGVTGRVISDWQKKPTASIRKVNFKKLAEVLGVSEAVLAGDFSGEIKDAHKPSEEWVRVFGGWFLSIEPIKRAAFQKKIIELIEQSEALAAQKAIDDPKLDDEHSRRPGKKGKSKGAA